MSYVNLAMISLHWRNEGETRINQFLSKCDLAHNNIEKIKLRAESLKSDLNCDPLELEEKYLECMHQLEQFNVLITGFNISVKNLEERYRMEQTLEDENPPEQDNPPVQDILPVMTVATVKLEPLNIIDVLSEPTPSKTLACFNQCPPEPLKSKKVPKADQVLIAFSSTSSSSESVPRNAMTPSKVKSELLEEVKQLTISPQRPPLTAVCNLPAQKVLEVDHVYPATIMSVDEASFWVITDSIDDVVSFMKMMTEYYSETRVELTLGEIRSLVYCSYYDDESDSFYRGLVVKLIEDDVKAAEIFLMDTGEVHTTSLGCLQPLPPQFCMTPPYARCCHLAGRTASPKRVLMTWLAAALNSFYERKIELLSHRQKDLHKFMKEQRGRQCSIKVDDNSSESLGVYVILPSKSILNDLVVDNGLALPIDKPLRQGPPEMRNLSESELDMAQGPEYEDPVEAVTGYSNRDEADICKHYKGGPSKTCFKGARCTKKHILKHPDGWTLDRVEVVAKLRSVPLPAPDTWHKVLVTYICHFDRVYVQFVKEKRQEEVPNFGVVLPPTTLEGLVRDMNSPAARTAYKPLKLTPAPGELVAALYPPDNQWYRARVLTVTRADQNVEVYYVDYGNVVWVKEDAVRQLEPRYLSLPAQGVRCVLAGVEARSTCSREWAEAKQLLRTITEEMQLDAHVIGREYDELIVELFDSEGYNIAEQLAAHGVVDLVDFAVVDDTKVTRKVVAA